MTTPDWPTPRLCPTRKPPPAPASLTRAAAAFAAAGVPAIRRVLTDNAWAYRRSHLFAAAVHELGATQKFIKPLLPPDQLRGCDHVRSGDRPDS